MTRRGLTVAQRFEAKIDKSGDCWLWTAARNEHGYGRFSITPGGMRIAHRFAYELYVGPIPEGLTLDHLCRTRACVNPAHLEPVTLAENQARRPGRTHCPSGHEFTPENTYVHASKTRRLRPTKHCRTCARERAVARRLQEVAA